MDFREKILKEGTLKHRQTTYALPRWKTRHVVFKISGGGRLQFTIHKDHPTSAANEVKEIPIEEFGGLESGSKVDSEKNVFSVITTNATDTFSTESVDDMEEWVMVIQEYLGKELTFGIVIPQKQGQLKSGRGVLRIRNTGFTITTSDSPPRCLGTWQITHIRKFGGTGSFKFQTGSKCPTGEMLYTIQTDDNAKVKSLFNDLSQHKPIFSDDRVGRRMTLERNHNHQAPYRQSPSRFSLQSTPGGGAREGRDSPTLAPTYENKEIISEVVQRLARTRETLPSLPHSRRHSSNDDRSPSLPGQRGAQGPTPGNIHAPPLSPAAVKVDDERMYQNLPSHSHGRASSNTPSCGSAPHSPTKPHRSGTGSRYPIPHSEPVPDGYYNVSPPLALKKYPSTQSSPPSQMSPREESAFFSEFAPVPPPPIKTVSSSSGAEPYNDGSYFRLQPQLRPVMVIEGENLVVQRTNGHSGSSVTGGECEDVKGREETVYQNLEFMNKRGSDGMVATSGSVCVEDTDSGGSGPVHTRVHSGTTAHPMPVISALEAGSDVVHNYTNVEFAVEAAQGMMGGKQLARAGDVRRKVSAPPLSRDRSGAMSYRDHTSPETATTVPTATTTTTTVVTSNLSVSLHPKLKPSLSSQDLKDIGRGGEVKKGDMLPEYYNLFVPRLPAHVRDGESLEERTRKIHATLSSFKTTSSLPVTAVVVARERQLSRESDGSGGSAGGEKSGGGEEDEEDYEKVVVDPSVTHRASHALSSDGKQAPPTNSLSPRYDHLELVRTGSGNQMTRFSSSPSPENLSRSTTPRPMPLYDQLAAKEPSPPSNENREESVGGVSTTGGPMSAPYERKVGLLGHTHTYEYIEVMLKKEREGGGRVPGPQISSRQTSPGKADTGMPITDTPVNEHPSQWTSHSTLPQPDHAHPRFPGNQSRRKPLPLQSVPLDESFGKSGVEGFLRRPSDQSSGGVGVAVGVVQRERSNSPVVLPLPPVRHAHQQSTDSLDGGAERLARNHTGAAPVALSHEEPTRTRDTAGFTVSLPATEFRFDKPLVPPRPRVLENKPPVPLPAPSGVQYATMRFPHSTDNQNYTQVYPGQRATLPSSGGEVIHDPTKVVYQSIDFGVTEGLRKTREDVENQRSREIEWLQLQGEQTLLKTLTAK